MDHLGPRNGGSDGSIVTASRSAPSPPPRTIPGSGPRSPTAFPPRPSRFSGARATEAGRQSNWSLAGTAATGSGIGVGAVGYVLGITKAYTTRVGSGPFPSELTDEIGQTLGERGREFGTVTGRKRRCGWFDAALVRQSAKVGGINGIALTKLDVLDKLPELKICIGYRLDGLPLDHLPAAQGAQARVEPVYETMEGWTQSTRGARSWAELPAQCIKYVRRLEDLIGAPVAWNTSSARSIRLRSLGWIRAAASGGQYLDSALVPRVTAGFRADAKRANRPVTALTDRYYSARLFGSGVDIEADFRKLRDGDAFKVAVSIGIPGAYVPWKRDGEQEQQRLILEEDRSVAHPPGDAEKVERV